MGAPPSTAFARVRSQIVSCLYSFAVVGALILLALSALGFYFSRPVAKESDLPEIESNARPLIAAIDRYVADKGWLPSAVEELVPGYLETIPTPLGGSELSYNYGRTREEGGQRKWSLTVWCGSWLDLDSGERIEFQSSDRAWRYHPR